MDDNASSTREAVVEIVGMIDARIKHYTIKNTQLRPQTRHIREQRTCGPCQEIAEWWTKRIESQNASADTFVTSTPAPVSVKSTDANAAASTPSATNEPRSSNAPAVIDRATSTEADVQAAIRDAVVSGRGLTIAENGITRMQIAARRPVQDYDDPRSNEAPADGVRTWLEGCPAGRLHRRGRHAPICEGAMFALKAYTTSDAYSVEQNDAHRKGGGQMSGAGTADRGMGSGMRGICFFRAWAGWTSASRDPASSPARSPRWSLTRGAGRSSSTAGLTRGGSTMSGRFWSRRLLEARRRRASRRQRAPCTDLSSAGRGRSRARSRSLARAAPDRRGGPPRSGRRRERRVR